MPKVTSESAKDLVTECEGPCNLGCNEGESAKDLVTSESAKDQEMVRCAFGTSHPKIPGWKGPYHPEVPRAPYHVPKGTVLLLLLIYYYYD